jgi:hypothetical protein
MMKDWMAKKGLMKGLTLQQVRSTLVVPKYVS